MIKDITKAIYWIFVFVVAMFAFNVLASSPAILFTAIGVGIFWWWINNEATTKEESKEDK